MSFLQTHAGINITGEKIQLVELTYSKEGILVENIDEEFFDEYLDFFTKETKFNSLLQKAFDNLIIRKPLVNNLVSFSLPYDIFKHVELPFDSSLIQSDLVNQFKWELSVLFPDKISDEYLLQYIEVDDEEFGKKETALIFASLKKQIKTIHKFCVRNSLKLKYIDYAHICVNNLVRTSSSDKNEDKDISIYLGNSYLSVLLLKKNSPVLVLVKKIANVSEIIPILNSFTENINKLNVALTSINNFYISGDYISDELIDKLNIQFETDFVKINPFSEFAVNPQLANSKYLTNEFNSFSAAAGMALRLL